MTDINHRKELIDELAHFLLLNSEAFKSNYLKDKLRLIHFFFTYSKIYNKIHYSNFAFEVLEALLHEELIKIKEEGGFFKSYKIGYSLMKFLENDFFESDDINEILMISDKNIFDEIKKLSRKKNEEIPLEHLIKIGFYLNERIKIIESSERYYLKIKEMLLITFYELLYHLDTLKNTTLLFTVTSVHLYKSTLNIGFLKQLSEEGLKKIQDLQILESEKISEKYNSLINSNNLRLALLYDYSFSNSVPEISQNRKVLHEKLKNYVLTIIKNRKENLLNESLLNETLLITIYILEDNYQFKKGYLQNLIDDL